VEDTRAIEEKVKALYERQMAAQDNTGAVGCANSVPPSEWRPSLRERIGKMRRSAERESRRAEKLRELDYLLDKNPEVERILNLMEIVKEY
jgi:hypothetical protein